MAKTASQTASTSADKIGAIDLGYGLVKAKFGDHEFLFPSVAIPADESTLRQAHGTAARNTVDVPVKLGGNTTRSYEVGPDILMAQTGADYGRHPGAEFANSPIYHALMLGALRYMETDHLDMLVLGLPVSGFLSAERVQSLMNDWRGEHDLGVDENGVPRKIVIDQVFVHAQPFGGYLNAISHRMEALKTAINASGSGLKVESQQDLVSLTILVVDPGAYTLDWMVLQPGGHISSKASGAADDTGRDRLIRAVFERLQKDIGRSLGANTVHRLNNALQDLESPSILLQGKRVDLAPYIPIMRAEVSDSVAQMISRLKGAEDEVNLVIVVGGHPQLYAEEVQKRFPDMPVFYGNQSVFDVVRGYEVLGKLMLDSERAEAA